MPDSLQTPHRQRPRVLEQQGVKRAPLRKLGDLLGRTLILDFLGPKKSIHFKTGPEVRADSRRRSTGTSNLDEVSCLFFGAAESQAGRLLVASLPRSKANVQHLLCVTETEIKLLHVPRTKRLKYYANAVEIGWRADRKDLEWTRSTASKHGNQGIQYGFTDGSWIALPTYSLAGQIDFTDVFPQTLTKEDPIPLNANYPEPEPKK
ncbi:MAG TPA: hypothetical protein VNS49_19985 [Streptomyces sp.]|nr:hypothetical protein [Streptomyces sp.]